MGAEVRRVESPGERRYSRSSTDVFGHAPRFIGVARRQVQMRSLRREPQRECARDRAGGAKNKASGHLEKACAVLQAGFIPSLRDRLDEKRLFGSATDFAACHLARFGYIARKVSGAMRAPLARYTRPPGF